MRLVQAADEERRRIGRDLHDGVQQRLVALGLWLEAADRRLPDDPDGAAGLIAQAREQVAEAGRELRDVARGLHPSGLAEQGLAGALAALAAGSPLPVRLGALPTRRLPEPVEVTAYFLAAEALSNAVKHAGASELTVAVADEGERVRIEVADDGAGGATIAVGSGLQGLADRIDALGGTLDVDSPAGAGTRLTAQVPLVAWRTPREPYLEYGYPGDAGAGERTIAQILAGEKRATICLAREWDLEGGPPRPGTRLPVRDSGGHDRAHVVVERTTIVRFADLDEDVVRAADAAVPSIQEWRSMQVRLYDAVGDQTAALLGEPGWRLTGDEPMLVMWLRPATP